MSTANDSLTLQDRITFLHAIKVMRENYGVLPPHEFHYFLRQYPPDIFDQIHEDLWRLQDLEK